jgi:xanthine dehydrogenase YagT iron-sulfur-binding subunit
MSEQQGVSRRGFLTGVSAGAIAASALPALEARAVAAETKPAHLLGPEAIPVKLTINGEARALSVEPRVTLLDALRNHLDLTGAKKVCDRATCGACTVKVDGKSMYACTLLAVNLEGRRIETVESLASGEELTALQQAFVRHDGLQCGFCTPGFVVACDTFTKKHPGCSREQVIDGLGGNLCRCGTYAGVTAAVLDAAAARGAGGGK